jgi:hypothetical protein
LIERLLLGVITCRGQGDEKKRVRRNALKGVVVKGLLGVRSEPKVVMDVAMVLK